MPVGTSFENSALKSSFSLSSLQGASGGSGNGVGGSPMKAPHHQERPYHSLTKKRKDPNRELWRRSWGSTQSNQSAQSLDSSATLAAKDDFWAALQPNYNYIMNNELIDSCKEANGELSANATPTASLTLPKELPSRNCQWSLSQLIADFTEICQWLTNMQEEVYSSPENLANRTLRASRMAELTASEGRRRRFLEQAAGALARGGAPMRAEVSWRARHLALKWDSVLQAMSPEQNNGELGHAGTDAEHELKCLRRWIREMEGRLPPLSLTAATSWTRLELDQKVLEHQVLQREVEWHGRIVSSVVRLCRPGSAESVAKALERRWHHLYIRALEWQCQLETCQSRIDSECSLLLPSLIDSDEEPVLKHPRLVGPTEDIIHNSIPANAPQEYPEHSSCDDDDSFSEDDDQPPNSLVHDSFSLKDTSTGSEADTEGSMVDDDNDIIMASLRDFGDDVDDVIVPDTPVAIFKTPDKMDHDQVVSEDMNADIDFVDGRDPEAVLNASLYDDDQPAPVTVIKRPKKPSDVSKFNRSNRKSKNCATFYFRHHDTDSDRQMVSGASGTEDKSQEETSEEEWTYTACDKENSPDNTDIMTSSFEQPSEALDDNESNASKKRNGNVRMKLEFGDGDDSTINAGSNETLSKSNKTSEIRNDTSNSQTGIEINDDKNAKPILNEHSTHQTLISKESIKRLVNQAEELVQKQAHHMKTIPKELAKSLPKKNSRNFKPLNFGEEVKAIQGHNKMSRIKEWLQQNDPNESQCDDSQQVLDSCDASGEYTTGDSEPDRQSVTSEELSPSVATYRNATSSQEHSINVATPTNQSTPEHTKVILRGKRSNSQTTRPWSVSCLSQLSYAVKGTTGSALNTPTADGVDGGTSYGRSSGMSISESALNTLATGSPGIGENSTKDGKYVFQGSTSSVKTTVQGNISSSTTINEGCINCFENLADSKHCATKRKRLKLRRRHQGALSNELETEELRLAQIASSKRGNRLVKSCSFSGRSSMLQKELKQERCTASDPSSSRNKSRFDTSSTSGNDSEEDLIKSSTLQVCLTRSNDRTLHASTSEDQEIIEDSTEHTTELAPKFKLGPEAGLVRPRMPINIDRERASLLGLTIVERSVLADLGSADRDSDVDRSVQTAGTEEHSSFSEQAWDFYQEKYNSEPYSEAPDSDAARRLLEFGDDYRAYIDSQSDCCSSLSAHPDHEPSPHMGRRRPRPLNYSPTDLAERNRKAAMGNPTDSPDNGSFGRRSKKSSSSNIDRKKSFMDSLERSKRSPGTESLERMKRAKKILTDSLERRNSKRSSISDCDLLNNQSQTRRKHTSSNSTNSDINNSSLEYQHSTKLANGNNKPDIIDSVNKRSRKPSNESNKSKYSNESNAQDSPKRYHDSSLNSSNSLDSPARRKRYSNNTLDDSSDGGNNPRNKSQSLPRRRGSSGIVLLPLPGSNCMDGRGGLDSDSDVDDVQHLIERSHSQLEATEAVLAKEETTPDLLQPNDYNEIIATCCENIRCLEAMLVGASQGDCNVLTAAQLRDIRGLAVRWSGARSSGESRATARRLHREMLALKGAVRAACPDDHPQLHTRAQLHHRVEELKVRLSNLQEQKTTMLKLNVSVHRLLTDVGMNPTTGSSLTDTLCHTLKDEVSDLYRLWEDCNESTSSEVISLEGALGTWGAWERGLAELKGALRGDSDTLRLIETALAAGDPARVAPHVSQIARLLSETAHQKGECGSFSDSGISDSGSEQELSERERRLAGLRAAARAMEAVLAPGSKLLKAMTKRMEQAEYELRALQTACRELIVRTAGGVAGAGAIDKRLAGVDLHLPTNGSTLPTFVETSTELGESPDDPENDPDKSSGSGRGRRWAWCTIPFQICLLALLCACLMGGPRCCDAVNNLGAGFTPHLRYVKGPPPV